MLGTVKYNEPNFSQTIYSSFLIWFTYSSSGKSSTIKTVGSKIFNTKMKSQRLKKKHVGKGAKKLTSKYMCNEAGHINKYNKAELDWTL